MLMEVIQAVKRNKWIVYLGWEPHAMNKLINMKYLDGGDNFLVHMRENQLFILIVEEIFQKNAQNFFFRQFHLSINDEQNICH